MAPRYGWTPERSDTLITNWQTKTVEELSELLECDPTTVRKQVNALRALGIDLKRKRPVSLKLLVKPQMLPADPKPVVTQNPPTAWKDGWFIKPPSRERLMGRK